MEEKLQIVEVRRHGRGVVEVFEDRIGLTAPAAWRRLKHHVVGEDRDELIGYGVLDVEPSEISVGIPGCPAAPGIDPAGQILVAEAERGRGLHRRRPPGTVAHSDSRVLCTILDTTSGGAPSSMY